MAAENPTPRAPRRASVLDTVTNLLAIGLVVGTAWLAWPMLWPAIVQRIGSAPAVTPTAAPLGNVGGQAPPSVRGTNGGVEHPQVVATPIPGIAQNEATAQALVDAAVQQAAPAPLASPLPLPQNSAGEPVIDAVQQEQMQQSLQLAEQEGAAAADAELAHLRQEANEDALSRPPDVSYEDAKALLHRDPCHVPRANPATCEQGLYKPTPIGAQP